MPAILDEEQHFQIDPPTAPFVLEAFKRYIEGATMKELIDFFKEKGIKNKNGGDINYNSIQRMLNNRRYIGEYAFRDIVVPDGIPAIIPKELFDRVQAKLAKNWKWVSIGAEIALRTISVSSPAFGIVSGIKTPVRR